MEPSRSYSFLWVMLVVNWNPQAGSPMEMCICKLATKSKKERKEKSLEIIQLGRDTVTVVLQIFSIQ
jgi:hypothetical protein